LAWPAAYFVVTRWLQDFAYRTSIGLGPFLLAGLLTLAVAVFSVIFQALKAALSDPVQSLRYE
jgi:putative ABC transport system permease protein